ncbi:MAG: GNAT family N-acetyltransferase [Lachnospiraceae bacterium]|nr:GNAT family N-acetyltransferase [Lachnospiraceae bacterium]
MRYHQTVTLKDGRTCVLRNGTEADAAAALANFILTHEETDFLASYPDEIRFTEEREAKLLKDKAESPWNVEILAEVDGRVAGLAGIDRISAGEKARHRASLGISIEKAYWGLGIGRALTKACIACAKTAGYTQLELEVVASNTNAVALYESEGFVEYGRNPLGFRSRFTGYNELILMRRELEKEK